MPVPRTTLIRNSKDPGGEPATSTTTVGSAVNEYGCSYCYSLRAQLYGEPTIHGASFTRPQMPLRLFEFHARQSPTPNDHDLPPSINTPAAPQASIHSRDASDPPGDTGRRRIASATAPASHCHSITDGGSGWNHHGAGATAPVGLVASHRRDAPHEGLRGRRPPPWVLLAAVAAVAHPPQGPRRRRVRMPHPPPPALLRQRRGGQGGRHFPLWNRRSREGGGGRADRSDCARGGGGIPAGASRARVPSDFSWYVCARVCPR
jgi:hypothetical protein